MEAGVCNLPPRHQSYVPLRPLIYCLSIKVLCQLKERITAWTFGKPKDSVYQSFLSTRNNNDIPFHIDHPMIPISQQNEKPTPIIFLLWLTTTTTMEKIWYGFAHVICRTLKEYRNTFQLNGSTNTYPPQMTLVATVTRSKCQEKP